MAEALRSVDEVQSALTELGEKRAATERAVQAALASFLETAQEPSAFAREAISSSFPSTPQNARTMTSARV